MKNIELKINRAFPWYHSERLHVKGYLFDRNSQFIYGAGLLKYFSEIQHLSDLEDKLRFASGSFSIIIENENTYLMASDIIRSFPIFYTKYDNHWLVSDDAFLLAEKTGQKEVNEIAGLEFLSAGYVTGSETLLKNICQVQAGEIVSLSSDEIRKKFYFTFRSCNILEFNYEDLRLKFAQLLDKAFEKFLVSLNGRTVCVSLSGGFDSRLIAVMLKKIGYDKVIAMTYGRKDNHEMIMAGKVAEKLKLQWHPIVYDDDLIKDYMNDEFHSFYKYSSNLTSMFFLQDYFAAKYLKEKNIIPEDSIIATGHAGDFLGGSQLNKHGNVFAVENLKDIARRIYNIKYAYKPPPRSCKEKLIQRIEKSLEEKFTTNNDLAYSIHEDWDFKEKLAKFNFNSLNTYTFFGYEFRFPFWDLELIRFCRDMPIETRINKYLFNDVLINDYFEPYDLNFENDLLLNNKILTKMKAVNFIKNLLPETFKRLFINHHDNIFYREITQYLVEDASKQGYDIKTYNNSYNSIIIQWYFHEIKKWSQNGDKI